MRRLSRLLLLVLFTGWLPVTQHCYLEAAGVIPRQCADACLPGQGADGDGCGAVETGAFKIATDTVKASAPDLLDWNCFLDLLTFPATSAEDAVVSTEPPNRPLDWVTTWNFVRRAAPPPRAPSLLCA